MDKFNGTVNAESLRKTYKLNSVETNILNEILEMAKNQAEKGCQCIRHYIKEDMAEGVFEHTVKDVVRVLVEEPYNFHVSFSKSYDKAWQQEIYEVYVDWSE